MGSDVRALLRPLVRTVGLFLAVALGVVACLLVLLALVRGSYAEAVLPLAGAAALPVARGPHGAAWGKQLTDRSRQVRRRAFITLLGCQ
jgi:hypothetical protein